MSFRPKMTIGVLGLALVAVTQSRAKADPPASAVVPWVFDLGDLDGDGVGDFAMAIPYEVNANSPSKITLYSGANNAILSTMSPRVNETGFGISIVPVNDVDHDGVGDIVVTALDTSEPANPGRSMIFSSTTGSLLATLRMRVGVGGAISENPEEVTPLLTGDLNGNRQIDGGDVETITGALIAGGTYSGGSGLTNSPLEPILDTNRDGVLDVLDVFDVVERMVTPAAVTLSQDVDIAVQEWATQAASARSSYELGRFQGNVPGTMGVAGCVWCTIFCGKTMVDAGNCGNDLKAANDACPDFPFDEQAACRNWNRLCFLPKCLAKVGKAAGECGKCAIKCGPGALAPSIYNPSDYPSATGDPVDEGLTNPNCNRSSWDGPILLPGVPQAIPDNPR